MIRGDVAIICTLVALATSACSTTWAPATAEAEVTVTVVASQGRAPSPTAPAASERVVTVAAPAPAPVAGPTTVRGVTATAPAGAGTTKAPTRDLSDPHACIPITLDEAKPLVGRMVELGLGPEQHCSSVDPRWVKTNGNWYANNTTRQPWLYFIRTGGHWTYVGGGSHGGDWCAMINHPTYPMPADFAAELSFCKPATATPQGG